MAASLLVQKGERKMTMPLVSILIRSVGRDFIHRALDSIEIQTYPNIEVVVVSAIKSHPPLPVSCGSYPIRLIDTEAPLKRGRAANVALDQARGEFALFLDDDDWLMPSHIVRLVEAMQVQPQVKAVYAGVSTVDVEGRATAQVFDSPFDFTRLRVENFIPINSVLFRVDDVRGVCRFDESLALYEDWDFWIQVCKLGPMVHIPGVSAVYRIHQSSGVHGTNSLAPAIVDELYRRWFEDLTCEEFLVLMGMLNKANSLRASVASLGAEVCALGSEVSALNSELENTQQDLRVLTNSLSWRITAPLRALSRSTGMGLMRHRIARLYAKVLAVKSSQGWAGVLHRVARRLGLPITGGSLGYSVWLKNFATLSPQGLQSMRADAQVLAYRPLISVVMPVYNPPVRYLRAAVESVIAQVYQGWEICVCDDASTDPEVLAYLKTLPALDARIKVKLRETNGHISATSNDALTIAEGEWVALLDHDDLLAKDALYWVVKTLQSHGDAGVVYSDEDKIGLDGKRCDPYFKPDWSPELLLSQNYISHLGVYRRSLLESVGGFRLGLEGSQDHDLVLRCVLHLEPHQVVHIPRVLYHWRVLPGSTALANNEKSYAIDAGVRAVSDYLEASGLGGAVVPLPNSYYRVVPSLPTEQPWVSLIIPTRNAHELVRMCLQSILEKTTYSNYDVLLVDNGSDDPDSLSYFNEVAKSPRVQVIRDDREFNFSALNNAAVLRARGEFVCLVNNDIEIITPGWLQEMVGLALRPGVGAVGARLWYPNDTLQHGGVIMGVGGVAGHAHLGRRRGDAGYFGRAEITQNFQAVTAACLLVRKSSYLEVGGLNEEHLKVAFNDIDFCMRLVEAGLRNVWTPFAEMYHHESATRGTEDTPAKMARFEAEVSYMIQRWGHALQNDPSYSPNLSLADGQFSLAFPPRG